MNLDIQKTIGGVFFLIMAYLLLANSSAFNTIVSSGGNFILSGISTLQGNKYQPSGSGYSWLSSFLPGGTAGTTLV